MDPQADADRGALDEDRCAAVKADLEKPKGKAPDSNDLINRLIQGTCRLLDLERDALRVAVELRCVHALDLGEAGLVAAL